MAVGLGVVLAIFVFLNKSMASPPQIVAANPTHNALAVSLEIKPLLTFDEEVFAADFTLASVPSISWTLSQSSPTSLRAQPALLLQPQTKYLLQIKWKDQKLPDYSFTTQTSQTDPLLIKNMKDELARDYPLAQSTPYTTPLYRVVYSSPMTLEITLKNLNITSQEAIDEIKEWVKSMGGDAEAHRYVIASPSPSP